MKPLPKTSDENLPDPNGALSATVPPSAIMKANEEVSKIQEQKPAGFICFFMTFSRERKHAWYLKTILWQIFRVTAMPICSASYDPTTPYKYRTYWRYRSRNMSNNDCIS